VPYKGFKTADGDILLGGGNDRLFGILCDKIGKPELVEDGRFLTNALRVKNRDILEHMIEEETKKKKTSEWLDIFKESGVPYAAVNDILGTLNHEHGKPNLSSIFSRTLEGADLLSKCLPEVWLERWNIQLVVR
jgi:succinate---hydroxymethylglutarate CoA-transferase